MPLHEGEQNRDYFTAQFGMLDEKNSALAFFEWDTIVVKLAYNRVR